MTGVFIGFWTVMIFASIAWYTILLFTVGWKGGKDIFRMARALAAQGRGDTAADPDREVGREA